MCDCLLCERGEVYKFKNPRLTGYEEVVLVRGGRERENGRGGREWWGVAV